MNKDIGIITYNLYVDDIGKSQTEFISDACLDNPYNQNVIFTSYSTSMNSRVPVLHLSHAKFFNGIAIVFDIRSLILAQQCINLSAVYFYANFIPWQNNIQHFTYWENIFNHAYTYAIASSQKVFDIYSLMYKEPIAVKEEFNYEAFKNILR